MQVTLKPLYWFCHYIYTDISKEEYIYAELGWSNHDGDWEPPRKEKDSRSYPDSRSHTSILPTRTEDLLTYFEPCLEQVHHPPINTTTLHYLFINFLFFNYFRAIFITPYYITLCHNFTHLTQCLYTLGITYCVFQLMKVRGLKLFWNSCFITLLQAQ